MVGQFLTGYLQQCGLEAEDVPKVAAAFLGAKYCMWAASVAVAVRYRPLRRVFLSRREALLGLSRTRPFSERKRLWLVEALDHVRNSDARAAGSARMRTRDWLKKLPDRARKAVEKGIANARARYQAANYSWKLAGWQHLRTQERHKLGVVPVKPGPVGWYSWSSAKYWRLSDKLSASAGSNRLWSGMTKLLNLNSKGLALGLAEGTILFKFTVPIHMPLMLFAIVRLHRRAYSAAPVPEASVEQAGSIAEAIDGARSNLQSTRTAAKDASSLVGWGWTWAVE
ncbi:Ankyrin repeat [Durusdinium trenchii]|uniref:PH and SEC7 domain containing protein secG n=1 Tax=Durusdinium trenchii TaxID=1381693 RepID=A0ABP0K670_9DINO